MDLYDYLDIEKPTKEQTLDFLEEFMGRTDAEAIYVGINEKGFNVIATPPRLNGYTIYKNGDFRESGFMIARSLDETMDYEERLIEDGKEIGKRMGLW